MDFVCVKTSTNLHLAGEGLRGKEGRQEAVITMFSLAKNEIRDF